MSYYFKKIVITKHAIVRARERLKINKNLSDFELEFFLQEVCQSALKNECDCYDDFFEYYYIDNKFCFLKKPIYMVLSIDTKYVVSFHYV